MSLPSTLVKGTLAELAVWSTALRSLLVPGDDGAINFVSLTRPTVTFTVPLTAVQATPSTWYTLAEGYVESEGGAMRVHMDIVAVLAATLVMPILYFQPRWAPVAAVPVWRYSSQSGTTASTTTGSIQMPVHATSSQRATQSWEETVVLPRGKWHVQAVGYYGGAGADPVDIRTANVTLSGNLRKTA